MLLEIFTAIALIVDRSGSMYSVAEDTKGSVKTLIETQKQEEGKAALTLVQFDHQYEVIHDFVDLKTVDADAFTKQYQPRGNTALVDAIGRSILSMDQKIDSLHIAEKPTRIVVAIITDGLENSSHEFTAEKVKKMVEEKQALGWDFIFLGADLNAIQTAQDYGFSPKGSAYYDSSNVTEAMNVINTKISHARQGYNVEISDEERAQLKK